MIPFHKKPLILISLALALGGCGRETVVTPAPDLYTGAGADGGMEAERAGTKDPSPAIAKARAAAQALMHGASERTRDEHARDLFRKMGDALGHAKIQAPKSGHDLKACIKDPSVLAFVMLRSPHTIHVCSRAATADSKELAQVLTHETAHVVGVHDECDATRVEVAIMRLSGAHLAFKNGYMDRCGIR